MTGSDAAPPTATDVVAGRYALCDPIGVGGSGTVWRAWDRTLGGYCAAKLLRRRDAGQLLRFVREQAIRLDGDHLASPYAWAAEDAEVLIASELVEGGSLHTLLGDYGPLAEGTVVVLLEQLLDALIDVHGAGLIHRDVKTDNVLLRASGLGPLDAMLTDFGLAIGERDARFTEIGMVIGTPGYLAPEVLAGSAELSAAQDLYAVGRLAVALLVGAEPRVGEHAIPPIADRELRSMVAALLAIDPANRPKSARVAQDALARAIRDPLPHNADGDAVAVLRQLPELPTGWDPDTGPNSAVQLHEHQQASRIVGRTAPQSLLRDSQSADTLVGQPSTRGAPAKRPGRPPQDPPPAMLPSRAGPQQRWRPWLWTVLAAVVVGFVAFVFAQAVQSDPAVPPPGVTGSSSTVSTNTTGATTATRTSSTVTTPAPPTPTSPTPVADAPTAGRACTFQEENDSAADPTGRPLQCRRTDTGYAWAVGTTTASTGTS